MSRVKLYLVALLLTLTALTSRAQSGQQQSAPPASQKELTVQVTLPTVVGLIGEYVGILSSKEKGKLKTITGRNRPRSTSNPVLLLSIPLPRVWSDSKPKREN